MKANNCLRYCVVLCIISFWSCVRDTDFSAPLNLYTQKLVANTSFAHIKSMYLGTVVQIQEDLIIEGYTVSSDETSNFFGSLHFQDKPNNATQGFQIEIDIRDSHLFYGIGSKIALKLKGLYLGKSKGVYKLGGVFTSFGNKSVGRLPVIKAEEHLFVTSNEVFKITPRKVVVEVLDDSMVNTLVQLSDIEIVEDELEKSFAKEKKGTTRTLKDCTGNKITLLNSGYADFYAEPMPRGNGTITAVLLKNKKGYLLVIRNLNDIVFPNERCTEITDEVIPTPTLELTDPKDIDEVIPTPTLELTDPKDIDEVIPTPTLELTDPKDIDEVIPTPTLELTDPKDIDEVIPTPTLELTDPKDIDEVIPTPTLELTDPKDIDEVIPTPTLELTDPKDIDEVIPTPTLELTDPKDIDEVIPTPTLELTDPKDIDEVIPTPTLELTDPKDIDEVIPTPTLELTDPKDIDEVIPTPTLELTDPKDIDEVIPTPTLELTDPKDIDEVIPTPTLELTDPKDIDKFTSPYVFISELADPNNNKKGANGRFVELYNSSSESLSLKGWTLRRYTNENTKFTSTIDLSGFSIDGESTFVISPKPLEFKAIYGFEPNLGASRNSPADSNGDDNLELVDPFGIVIDRFGIIGEDGSNTNHEFEDGRAFRKSTIMRANATYTFEEWMIYNDTGASQTINYPKNAPEDFTPGTRD